MVTEGGDQGACVARAATMVAHKCTPLRNTVRHRPGAVAVVRKAATIERKATAVVQRVAAGEQSGHNRSERLQ